MEIYGTEADTDKTFLKRCNRMLQHSLKHNDLVKFLIDSMASAGCPISSKFFSCRRCPAEVMAVGGFNPEAGIIICQNRVHKQYKMDNLLVHELIHAYDACVRNVKWDNCNHHACTEVRAAHLSGDCTYLNEANRLYAFDIYKHEQACVKRRAWESVRQNPNCSDQQARRAVERVFKYCYRDIRPWHEYPWAAKKDPTKPVNDPENAGVMMSNGGSNSITTNTRSVVNDATDPSSSSLKSKMSTAAAVTGHGALSQVGRSQSSASTPSESSSTTESTRLSSSSSASPSLSESSSSASPSTDTGVRSIRDLFPAEMSSKFKSPSSSSHPAATTERSSPSVSSSSQQSGTQESAASLASSMLSLRDQIAGKSDTKPSNS